MKEMTEDVFMSNDVAFATNTDAARNQFQQFCASAKTADTPTLLDLIRQVLEAPGIYVFAELLVLPNVEELKEGPHKNYYDTLNLFAYGTYKQYREKTNNYIELSSAMQKKLQHLTIVSLAIKTKSIPYAVLLDELEIDNVRHLEDVIIEAIYADIIHGKLFQNNRILEIDYAQGRDIPPGVLSKIANTLEDWVDSCEAVSKCTDMQIKLANTQKLNRLKNKDRIEQELNNLKRMLKTQIADSDDAMQGCVYESTSQEVRKKSGKIKTPRSSVNLKFNK